MKKKKRKEKLLSSVYTWIMILKKYCENDILSNDKIIYIIFDFKLMVNQSYFKYV